MTVRGLPIGDLPVCTEPKFDPVGTSAQIHGRVSELLASALSVYRVKTEVLAELRPTHIITQAQCEVCAVSLSDVEKAVAELTSMDIQVVSLQPECLADVWDDMTRVAAALSESKKDQQSAAAIISGLKKRLQPVEMPVDISVEIIEPRPKVACIEWTEPLMAAGNWVPELVDWAGGTDCLGKAGRHSAWISWEDLQAADPDVIIVMPCGYDLAQARQAAKEISAQAAWQQLRAVENGRVYLTDGNQYFNRPGPRLVESGEILAEIIWGEKANGDRQFVGWEVF